MKGEGIMRKYVSPALALLVSAGLGASAQVVYTTPGTIVVSSPNGWTTTTLPVNGGVFYANEVVTTEMTPTNALYHQVVDRYYDSSGQEVETRSATHVVGYDCHSGRHQQDLIVEDDGKGGTPRFVALLMGNEPATGQKPVTAEDKVRIILAANKHAEDVALPPASVLAMAASR